MERRQLSEPRAGIDRFPMQLQPAAARAELIVPCFTASDRRLPHAGHLSQVKPGGVMAR